MTLPVQFHTAASKAYANVERQLVNDVRAALGPMPDPAPEPDPQSHPQSSPPSSPPDGESRTHLEVVTVIGSQGHVLLSHSVRDRNYYCDPRHADGSELQKFDAIFVPGQWLRRRLLGLAQVKLSPHAVIAVGHPRIDYLRDLQASQPRPAREDAREDARLRVLWAPGYAPRRDHATGHSTSTNPSFLDHVDLFAAQCDLTLRPHPRDRQPAEPGMRPDYTPLGSELIDCDVVVTDSSSVIFEAWALGKPVIFPRWLIGNEVIRRTPGSAEAQIHSQRIGYHPDSPEEMLAILQEGPVVGDDVEAFMLDYLETYRRGNSVALISAALQRLADPERMAAYHAREAVIVRALAAFPVKALKPEPPRGVRASIQLLQTFFLQGDYAFLSNAISSLRQAQGSADFLQELAVIEIEAALAQGMSGAAEGMIQRLEAQAAPPAEYFRARLALMANQPLQALERIGAYMRRGVHTFPACQVLLESLAALGEHTRFWTLARRILASRSSPELLQCLARHAQTLEEWHIVREACAKLDRLPGMLSNPVLAGVQARLALQTSGAQDARARLLARALKAAQGTPEIKTFEGWCAHPGLPLGLMPLERLPAAGLRLNTQRVSGAFDHILRQIRRLGLPLFLSRATLQRWLAGKDSPGMGATLEFGLIAGPDSGQVLARIAQALMLEPLSRQETPGILHYRHLNGSLVTIARYRPAPAGGLELNDDGLLCRFPAIDPVWQSRGGREALVPADTGAYMAACFDDARQVHAALPAAIMARDAEMLNEDLLVTRLCVAFITARAEANDDTALAFARQLKRYGEHGVELALSGMDKSYLPKALPDLMREARFILHVGDGIEAGFHIDLWYDYVKDADPNALVAVRSKALFDRLRSTRPELDAIYIKGGIEAEWLVTGCPRLAGILYLSNTGNTVHFLRVNHVKHVWLGHGDSEKAASCHKFFRAYDEIWCAGLAQVDRFRNSGMAHDSLRFRVVGRPMLRPLIAASDNPPEESFLYLPTWEGFQAEQEYTSIREASSFIPALVQLTERSAWLKFHPWTGQRLAALNDVEAQLANTPGLGNATVTAIPRKEPVGPLMPAASFLVADVSSVVTDYLLTGRPIFLFMPLGRDLRMTASAMPMESYCYVFHDQDQLVDLVRRVIVQGDDFLQVNRLRARDYFVDTARSVNRSFESELRDMADRHDTPDHAWKHTRPMGPVTRTMARPMIIGHRGTKATVAENSLSGFRAAAAMAGLDGVEFDLHLTADAKIAVLHDPTLDRTTNGEGPVALFTMDALRALRLKDIGSDATGLLDEGIPDLDEVLDIYAQTGHALFIELKNDALGNPYPGLPEMVLDRLRQRGLLDRCTLTSFAPEVLRHLRYLDPNVRLVASVNYRSVEMLGGVRRCFATFDAIPDCGISLHHSLFQRLLAAGEDLDYRRFGLWVLNSEGLVRSACQAGVREIFTDHPNMVIALTRELWSNSPDLK